MRSKISLDKNLFWDVKFESLEYKKDADFIIEKVLNFGNEKDYQKIKKIYGLQKIKKTAKKINYTSKKNINFWSVIFNIPSNLFKCTKKFSRKKQSIFLTK